MLTLGLFYVLFGILYVLALSTAHTSDNTISTGEWLVTILIWPIALVYTVMLLWRQR